MPSTAGRSSSAVALMPSRSARSPQSLPGLIVRNDVFLVLMYQACWDARSLHPSSITRWATGELAKHLYLGLIARM